MKYQLRPYQEEAVKTINNLPDGAKSVCVLATGLGKTLVASQIDSKGRVLWLSHRDELVRQPEKYFSSRGISFGIEKADETSSDEKVVSASIQSISRDNRLNKFDPNEFDIIIVDEAHHAAAPSYRKVISYFKPRKLLGLTATPQRGDKVRLTDVFNDICFSRDLRWGIENNYLARIRSIRVKASFDMKSAKKSMGDFTANSLTDIMDSSDNADVVAKAYYEICYKDKRQTLVYCPTVKVCDEVVGKIKELLPKNKKDIVVVLSDRNSTNERREILDKYNAGKIQCIVNCMILTEGTDLVTTSAIICDRPSANPSLYQQIVGRGTRLHKNKEYCLVIDIIGKNSKFKNICTAPSLLGLDPDTLSEELVESLSDGDLLDNVDTILDVKKARNKNLKLVVEMYDLFTNDRINIIGLNADKNDPMKRIAKDYEHFILAPINDYDFGDLLVTTTPDVNRYYKIKATYKGNIYLSKPDMLDNTEITFDIPGETDKFNEIRCISPKMPMDKAIELIKNVLLYAIPAVYGKQWSRKARDVYKNEPASQKQIGLVAYKYQNRLGEKSLDNSLSKLEASDLIDLSTSIEENIKIKNNYRKEYEKQQKEPLTKDKVVNANFETQKDLFYKKNYNSTMESVLSIIEDNKKSYSNIESSGRIELSVSSPAIKLSAYHSASPAQIDYIKKLLKQNTLQGIKYNVSIEKFIKGIGSKKAASIAIDILIKNRIFCIPDKTLYCNLERLLTRIVEKKVSENYSDFYMEYEVI